MNLLRYSQNKQQHFASVKRSIHTVMERLFIKNRKKQKMAVIVEIPDTVSGLAFVMHGLSGFKEQPHIETIAKVFLDHGYVTVRFDTTNTLGESDGTYENATTTNYYEDLEDVIAWAKTQPWFQSPLALAGHSLGGTCTTLYSQRHPEEVKLLAPIALVVSGSKSMELYGEEELKNWQETGWHITESHSKPGTIRRLAWSHVADRIKYDLFPEAKALTMPVLLVVGENDALRSQSEILLKTLPGPKEIHVVAGAEHTFRSTEELIELSRLFNDWLDRYDSVR